MFAQENCGGKGQHPEEKGRIIPCMCESGAFALKSFWSREGVILTILTEFQNHQGCTLERLRFHCWPRPCCKRTWQPWPFSSPPDRRGWACELCSVRTAGLFAHLLPVRRNCHHLYPHPPTSPEKELNSVQNTSSFGSKASCSASKLCEPFVFVCTFSEEFLLFHPISATLLYPRSEGLANFSPADHGNKCVPSEMVQARCCPGLGASPRGQHEPRAPVPLSRPSGRPAAADLDHGGSASLGAP